MIKKVSYTFINIIFIILFLEISLQVIYRIISGNYLLNRANIPIYENSDICCWKLKKNLSLSHEKTNLTIIYIQIINLIE